MLLIEIFYFSILDVMVVVVVVEAVVAAAAAGWRQWWRWLCGAWLGAGQKRARKE
jgi:hypothetical protein